MSGLDARIREMNSATTKAECDHCYRVAPIRQDGTYGVHYCTVNGMRQRCEHVGKRYAFHMGTFRVIERGPDRVATLWHCECRCGEMKTGPTYESVEQWHADHYGATRKTSSGGDAA